jgi:Kdo2-lipid IVA lauroyltransferase/acyltransferase
MENLILFIVRLIPRGIGLSFFRTLGLILFYLMPNRRKIAFTNLEICLGKEISRDERKKIAKESFQNSISIGFDFLKILQMPPEEQSKLVQVSGEENLIDALDVNNGIFAVSAHLGNFPLMLTFMSKRGLRVNVVTRQIKAKWADRLYTGMLNRFGTGTITKERVALGIIRALKNKEIVGYVLDQNMQRDTGIFVDFFGRKASTIRGLATFTNKYGSPILPAYVVSSPHGHRIFIDKPYIYDSSQETELELTQRFTSMIESWIRKYPEQWIWYHRRFKTRPAGEDRIYPRKLSLTKRYRRWKRQRPIND